MQRQTFDDYINRFNQRDMTAFDDYIASDLTMQNGNLLFHGRQSMKDHYALIWSTFREELHVERFMSDEENIAIQMWAHFTAERSNPTSPFGAAAKGDTYDYRGLILYKIKDGKFSDIRVAYLSFVHTGSDGKQINMGIPH
jgi:hypothetical protein